MRERRKIVYKEVRVECEAEVNIYDLMDELTDEELIKYINDRNKEKPNRKKDLPFNEEDIVEHIFHGDLDYSRIKSEVERYEGK